MKTQLPMFEGRSVQAGAVRLTGKAGSRIGTLDYDEEVYLVVKARVTKITHGDAAIDGTTVFARLHTLGATAIFLVDDSDGERMLDEAAMLADERFGIQNLFSSPGPDSETGEITE